MSLLQMAFIVAYVCGFIPWIVRRLWKINREWDEQARRLGHGR